MPDALAALRERTAADHDAVDAAYGRYDLSDRDDYARFLIAHARALPAVEAVLATRADLPPWPPRTEALFADLAELEQGAPAALTLAPPADAAAAWGMHYVVEGSRLGGVMLARRVPAELPRRYLDARHGSGAWRALLTAMAAAAEGDARWADRATAAARATFALYLRAVDG